jgi:hypothetical protein
MSKGFFIGIIKQRKGTDECWKANYIHSLPGWNSSKGASLEEVIEFQKEQYQSKTMTGEQLPDLVGEYQGPMASGKIIRFVQIEN